jgi:hypothetical protein
LERASRAVSSASGRVPFRGDDAGVAEAFLDHLQVRATGETGRERFTSSAE